MAITIDSRFVAGLTSVQGGKFANLSDGTRDISMSTFATRTAIGAQDFIENYSTAIAPGIANLVAKRDGSVSGNDLSGLEGPRGCVTLWSTQGVHGTAGPAAASIQ